MKIEYLNTEQTNLLQKEALDYIEISDSDIAALITLDNGSQLMVIPFDMVAAVYLIKK